MTPPRTRLARFLYGVRAYVEFVLWRLNMAVRENR